MQVIKLGLEPKSLSTRDTAVLGSNQRVWVRESLLELSMESPLTRTFATSSHL